MESSIFADCSLATEAAADASKTNKRQKKEAVKIDFMTPSEKSVNELAKEIFAPVTKGAGINLPGTGPTANKKGAKKKKEKRDDHRLPDDMHFSSAQLVTLFTKPLFRVLPCVFFSNVQAC